MTFGTEWGNGTDAAGAQALFDQYANAGGNFLDTANRYTEGTSERLLSDLVAADRAHWVLATKYSLYDEPNDPNRTGNHRKNLRTSLEGSLKRLKTDYIDLLWVHAWDFSVAPQEVMRSLDDLVRAGKVLHIGVSDTPAWIVAQANTLAELRGWSAFTALQIEYSLIERTPERELLPMARAIGLPITPWSPLGAGLLSGKYQNGLDAARKAGPVRLSEQSKKLNDKNLAIAAVVGQAAEDLGCTSAQVALSWLRAQGEDIIPILGVRTPAQLADNMGCLAYPLPKEWVDKLNEVSAVPMGFPHEFLGSEAVGKNIYGNTGRFW
jgi:aryl-alcohol dehydrogenase-like predicted oxidoreductase